MRKEINFMKKDINKVNTMTNIFAVIIILLGLIVLLGITLFPDSERYVGQIRTQQADPDPGEGGGPGSGGDGSTFLMPACIRSYSSGGYEGFCVPIVESMSFGIPVIGSDSSAVPSTIGRGGICFKTGDSTDLKNKITQLLNNNKK